ncbi:hypothetical protein FHS18_004520 [Paenibacillus phyllosphaerae]|uniref:Uncharacterized protein n=1 Tax=Paenibacillus phyllosphaerae TaxID=274593 RepID=A0A7W5B1J2_9BACL|nr:hypothetical protein [Paenibacillus phyllosphaerae]MBB3112419.1 hypothetical protein [Paenibacillus phyllosphaerae]
MFTTLKQARRNAVTSVVYSKYIKFNTTSLNLKETMILMMNHTMKTWTIAALAALTVTTAAASASAASTGAAASQAQTQTTDSRMSAGTIAKFAELVKQPGKLAEANAYLYANMGKLTIPQVTTMVLQLEDAIAEQLPAYEKKFETEAVQQAITKIYKKGDTLTELIVKTKDAKLKALFRDARNSGYKLDTGEGMFYLTVNYGTLSKYSSRVQEDIRGYIAIAAQESNRPALRDGALAITYSEVVLRSVQEESFLSKFPKSARASQVKAMFELNETLTFYGANNTPLFDYDTKVIQPLAKVAYLKQLNNLMPDSSPYLNKLEKFMALLEDEQYTLTDAVVKFRNQNVPIQ